MPDDTVNLEEISQKLQIAFPWIKISSEGLTRAISIKEDPLKFFYIYWFFTTQLKEDFSDCIYSLKFDITKNVFITARDESICQRISEAVESESKGIEFAITKNIINKGNYQFIIEKAWFLKFLSEKNINFKGFWKNDEQEKNDEIIKWIVDSKYIEYGRVIFFGKDKEALSTAVEHMDSFQLRSTTLNDYLLDMVNPIFYDFNGKGWIEYYKSSN